MLLEKKRGLLKYKTKSIMSNDYENLHVIESTGDEGQKIVGHVRTLQQQAIQKRKATRYKRPLTSYQLTL